MEGAPKEPEFRSAEVMARTHRRQQLRRPMRRPIVIASLVVLVLVVVGTLALVLGSSSNPNPAVPPPAHPVAAGPTSTTTTAPSTPTGLAQSVVLNESDFSSGQVGTGWVDQGGGGPRPSHSTPGPCAPFTGAPWLAYVDSDTFYEPATKRDLGHSVGSDAVVMPVSADASTAMAVVESPGYITACEQPAYDQTVQQSGLGVNQGSACGFQLQGSTISALPATDLNLGQYGFEYSANGVCSATGKAETLYYDDVTQAEGAVIVHVSVESPSKPDWQDAAALAQVMAQRVPS